MEAVEHSVSNLTTILNQKDVNGKEYKFDGKTITYEGKNIGFIEEIDGKLYYRKKEEEEQRYRKDDAWSIDCLICLYVDVIQYQTELRAYEVDAITARSYPIYVYNNEPKYYVPVSAWKILLSNNDSEQKRIELFGIEWFNKLRPVIENGLLDTISDFVRHRIQDREATVYPPPQLIFRAYQRIEPDNINVVIVTNEPYDDAMADGLALSYDLPFGYNAEVNNVQTELERTGFVKNHLFQPEKWTKQGCLMINAILTTEKLHKFTHEGIGWEDFTKHVIQVLNEEKRTIIFALLGTKTLYLQRYISNRHIVFKQNPFNDDFVGSDIFVKINKYLEYLGKPQIKWQ